MCWTSCVRQAGVPSHPAGLDWTDVSTEDISINVSRAGRGDEDEGKIFEKFKKHCIATVMYFLVASN